MCVPRLSQVSVAERHLAGGLDAIDKLVSLLLPLLLDLSLDLTQRSLLEDLRIDVHVDAHAKQITLELACLRVVHLSVETLDLLVRVFVEAPLRLFKLLPARVFGS